MRYLKPIILFLSLFTGTCLFSQDVIISDVTANTCSGTLFDTGGNGPGEYANNENHTITICPDTPGDVIYLDFVLFDLDQTGAENTWDYIAIWDGDNTGETSLGVYTGDELQNVVVTGTNLNSSGCLTLRFVSNNAGTGQFAASITCTTPCERPTVAATDDGPINRKICVGDVINFDGSGSYAEPGYAIVDYIWEFGDGTVDTTSGAITSHSFSLPGEYIVQLFVVDDNGCINSNLIDLQFLVSTFPTFDPFPSDTTLCIGEQMTLGALPNDYEVQWVGNTGELTGEEFCNSDEVGVQYSSEQLQSGFLPGQTLTSADDIESICVDMEHSFIGDLLLQIECPTGETVILHQQGGGGTDLGEIGTGDVCETPGVGYIYCWTNDATETWVDASGGGILPEGDYAPVGDLNDLIGCPLNGVWSFLWTDLWGADDGYLFTWGINFSPEFYPDVTEFTPNIGAGADSSSWSESPVVTSISSDGNTAQVSYFDTGEFPVTYSMVNDHGCAFDSTITITYREGPEAYAGEDLQVCADSVQLNGWIIEGNLPPICDFTIELEDSFGDGWNGCSIDVISSDGTFIGNYTIASGSFASYSFSLPSDEEFDIIFNAGSFINEVIVTVLSAGGSTIYSEGPGANYTDGEVIFTGGCGYLPSDLEFHWEPPTGLSDPNISDPMAFVQSSTTYTLFVNEIGRPLCGSADQVTVTVDPLSDPGMDNDTIVCFNLPTFQLTDALLGSPVSGGTWTDPAGNIVPGSFSPTDYPDGGDFVFTYTVVNGLCQGVAELSISVLPATDLTCCQTNAVPGEDVIVCDLSYQLSAEAPLGIGTWSGPENVSFSDIHDPNATVTATSPGGEITITWTDNNGFACSESNDIVVVFSNPISLDIVTIDANCADSCDGQAIVIPYGGLVSDNYNYDWSGGVMYEIPQNRDSLCQGTYSVKVFDDFGCTDSLDFTIFQPEAQNLITHYTAPSCVGECDGKIIAFSQEAVDYSFDGGVSYTSSNEGEVCAGTYAVIARNLNGCMIVDSVLVSDPPLFTAMANINPSPTTTKNTLVSYQNISSPGPIAESHWIFGTNNFVGESFDKNGDIKFPSDTSGVYGISMVTTSINGCTDSLLAEVIIHDDLQWYIPNSFTPNGDGINDTWKPVGDALNLLEYDIKIYDRYGKIVFHSTDYKEWWNGAVPGNNNYYGDATIFPYVLTITSATTEERHKIRGFITMIR